ncbi:type II toxin-antitoxin system death-on-curing family toxin [Larkinella sp. C7]|uniref:type II toxin-antitoxin system death-on-curing family toxin n=1 Tax=Larkinella sp. C7 TaxID=2576607 RepID=UPI0011111EDA|nr:type II toxin-antitoxin system death-on-curing family toxin [Larkinella sp. C7]
MPFLYFSIEWALHTHDQLVIAKSGGFPGVKDINYLESPLGHVQNDLYYPELVDKLTHLVYSLNKNHAFRDGNKRTSIALGAYFLEINGYDFCVSRFIKEMENTAVDVADNRIGKDLLFEMITCILNVEDYSEELKLKIISAKQSGLIL